MRLLFAILIVLIPSVTLEQIPGAIVLGGPKPTPAQVQQAYATIEAAKGETYKWNVGDFEFIVPHPDAKGQWVWDVTDESILSLKPIPANTGLIIENAIRAGSKERKDHEFPPQTKEYYRAKAIKVGKTTIKIWANGENGGPPKIIGRLDVQVGDPQPDPTPPGPTPDPNPPGPTPIPVSGLRVLIVYESKDLSNYPASQIAAMNAQEVRQYLTGKCAKANGHPEWRVWDKDTDISRESNIWQEAMKRPRQNLPWILISDGQKGFEGPLPANTDDLMKLLKQYGGN